MQIYISRRKFSIEILCPEDKNKKKKYYFTYLEGNIEK